VKAINPPSHRQSTRSTATIRLVSDGGADQGERRRGPCILVVDDEPHIVDLVATALRYEGFEVVGRATGREALAAAELDRPDLIVLDVMLPDVDGIEVARTLRRHGLLMPVVFLTARDRSADAVAGLTAGGDDYVRKPFSLEELIARIRAVLARVGKADRGETLRYADIELDDAAHEVRRAGSTVDLTPTEYNLLHLLLENPRRVLSRAQILDRVWRYDFDGNGNVVDLYVGYLRRKLAPFGPPIIRTVRGVGYVLRSA
jgi:two-component system, OmpR family, response regulator